jgi:hypothetical protein
MRSTARSTLILFAVVAAAAIVGVVHAAEARTVTTAAAPRPKVMEAGRFGWGRPTKKVVVTSTCIVPTISTTGVVTATCQPSTPATLSRFHHGLNGFHGFGGSKKHGAVAAQTCCDGYVCAGATLVTAKLAVPTVPWTTIVTTSSTAPYASVVNNNGRCCLPEADIDVTKLLCPPSSYNEVNGCIAADTFPIAPSFSTITNALACLCCSGKISAEATTVNTVEFECNPLAPDDIVVGICPLVLL